MAEMSEISELEKLYLPSYWSKRYSHEELLQKHQEITTELSNKVRKEIPCELNIEYANGERQKLDIFGTTLPNDAPIFIFIHGGYWQEFGKDSMSFVARSLYKKGCKTIVIGYTLCPQTTIAGIIEEIQQALKQCLKYASEKKTRSISIGGHSAGAHLAINLFPNFFNNLTTEEQDLIKSVFLIGGIYNLTPLVKTTINDPLKLTESSAEALSPMFYNFETLAKKAMKIYIIVGENESPAFIKQSQLFSENLSKQKLENEFILLEKLDHFDIVEKFDNEDYEVLRLIVNTLS